MTQFSASPNPLSTYPRINYVSIAVDETMDEVFAEADHIALKYLSEQQLSELQRQSGQRARSVRFSDISASRGRLIRGHSELGAIFRHEHARNESVVGSSDYTWNNLSFATRNYLGKYHLAPAGCANAKTDNEARGGDAGAPADGQNEGPEKAYCAADGGAHSMASQPCGAPPPTPEPRHNEAANILDIGRLKKLPKLF